MSQEERSRAAMEKHRLGGRVALLTTAFLHPAHLRRTGLIALIVGTWLTLFNQGDIIWSGEMGGWLFWVKVGLNYLTPFVVANLGLFSRSSEGKDGERRQDHTLPGGGVDGGMGSSLSSSRPWCWHRCL